MPEKVVSGVTLAQYASVQAAVSEGIPLETALRLEGIDPLTWPAIEDTWQELIFDDEERDGFVLEEYDGLLVAAQERYARRIPPIDEDLPAWLDFVRGVSEQQDVGAFLARFELTSNDLLRLHRLWARRLEGDAALRAQALEVMQKAPRTDHGPPRPERRADVAQVVSAAATRTTEASSPDANAPRPPLSAPFPGRTAVRRATPNTPAIDPTPVHIASPAFASPNPAQPAQHPFGYQPPVFAVQPPVAEPPTAGAPPHAAFQAPAPSPPAASRDAVPAGTLVMSRPKAPEAPAARTPINETLVVQQSSFPAVPGGRQELAAEQLAPPAGIPATAAAGLPPTLTLAQYASMMAELLVGRAAKVYEKYGLSDPQIRQVVLEVWSDRLKENPAEYAQWQQIYSDTLVRLGVSGG